MKNFHYVTRSIFYSAVFGGLIYICMGCETIIDPKLAPAEPVLAVDAWLNNDAVEQTIRLTRTQSYFDSAPLQGVAGATVTVKNVTSGASYSFKESGMAGEYTWTPSAPKESLGKVGDVFRLELKSGGEEYKAESRIGRVPAIDSISFIHQPPSGIIPESYVAEFFAIDPKGKADTYWIKAWKNDTLLLRPSEINLAFDAGFSDGSNLDGVTFITPIRRAITPFVTDEDGNFVSPYNPGDSVYVEIHSISLQAFNFLTEVTVQTDRPGGFQELFAAPVSNVGTNLVSVKSGGKPVVGFFNVSAISRLGRRFKKNN
ncbi:MAG: DUF4249 domain-containing protein [Bacteroidetes bacterium]|nr:DUF4249 domain-containing protein [Bacteroidota bacterium]